MRNGRAGQKDDKNITKVGTEAEYKQGNKSLIIKILNNRQLPYNTVIVCEQHILVCRVSLVKGV